MVGLSLVAGCAGANDKVAAPQPAKTIDASRFYEGRWYEIARTPISVTDGCVAGTTDFYKRPDGQLVERDACRVGSPDGKEKVFEGAATILDPGANTKLKVHYILWGFIPINQTYWILDHGEAYDWFIVSDPALQNVALLTRTPRPSAEEIEALKARTRQFGYDTGKLEFPTLFPPGKP